MKKHLLVAVCILLVAVTIAGCTQDQPTPETIIETVIETVVVEKDGETIIETVVVEKEVVVEVEPETEPAAEPDKVILWSPCDSGTVADWEFDPILQAVEDATNTEIEITNLDWGVFVDQLNASALSGEFPDIAGVIDPAQRSVLESWAADGVIAPFMGAVAGAAPNLLAEYENNSALAEITIEGTPYFQPVGWGDELYPNMGLFHVRKDLLDAYGMEPPDTFEQYFEYVETCQANGDGSGIIFSGIDGVGPAINGFAGAYSAPMRGWVKVDGGYEFWAIQPGVKDGLILFNEMMSRGLVDPAVWEMDGDMSRTSWVSGGACSYIANGGGHIGRYQNDMVLVDESFQEWLLPALDAGAGSRGYTAEPMFWGTSQLGGLEQNNPEAAARVINFLISEEGYKLTAVGIEGRDYEMVDGEIVLLDQRSKDGFPTEAGDTGAHPLASCIVSWVPQEWQNWQLLYGTDSAYKEWFEQMWANQGMYQITGFGQLTTTPLWSDYQPTSNDLVARAFLDVVNATSADEAATIFDQFVADWLAAGGEDAQAEMSDTLSSIYK